LPSEMIDNRLPGILLPFQVSQQSEEGVMALETVSHSQSMIRLLMGYIPTRVIYVAAKLELVDHIGDKGASAQELDYPLRWQLICGCYNTRKRG
jgi:hypothetical protein